MAWIESVNEEQASGELKRLYGRIVGDAGAVANILKIYSLAPDILQKHLELYISIMHTPGALSQRLREMIAVRVSHLNDCDY